jgi:hypothetical protein
MAAQSFLFFFFNRSIKHRILHNPENGGYQSNFTSGNEYQSDVTDVLTTNKQIL